MKSFSFVQSLEDINIQRFLRRSYVERAVSVAKIVVIAAMGLCAVYVAWQMYTNAVEADERLTQFNAKLQEGLALSSSTSGSVEQKRDFSVIANRAPFGAIGVSQTSNRAQPTPKPVAVTPLILIGTFMTDGQEPFAIIEEQKKKTQEVFNLNDTVFGEAKLTAILSDRVEILRNGQKEVLTLDTAPEVGAGAAASGGDTIVVDETELDKALENLPLLLTQARAVPFFKEGRAVGLRLFAIRAGSLFEKIGLQNGDVLKSVNGNSLADLSQAMQLFQKLKEERNIAVTLERGNAERTLQYQIR